MELQNIIFHKVITEQHKTPVTTVPREKSLDLPEKKADYLVNEVLNNYDREVSLAYAGFTTDSLFPNKLNSFLSGQLKFYDFSIHILDQLRLKMLKVPASTGGYLTIAKYNINGDSMLLLILLKDKDGIGISSDLKLEEDAIPLLRDAVEYADSVRDYVSRDLFAAILTSEEDHVDSLEDQFDLIERMGIENYIQLQSAPAEG